MSEETQIKSKSSILPPPDRRPDGFTPLYRPTRAFFRLYYALKGGLSVYGAENIPETGGVILATNHISLADPPVLAAGLKRPLRYMAKIELFENKFFGNIITQLGAFPIERGAADRAAIRKALSIVANGELLVIFPEGSRGDGITLGPPEKGVSLIALKSGAPIVPGYLDGTNILQPRDGQKPQRAHLTVRFGVPIDPVEYAGKGALDAIGPVIMQRISQLRDEHRKMIASK